MRTVLILASMATMAVVGYIYAPRAIDSRYKTAEAAAETPKNVESDFPGLDDQPAPSLADINEASPKALPPPPAPPAMQPAAQPKTASKAAPKAKTKARALQKTKKTRDDSAAASGDALAPGATSADVEQATGLHAAAKDSYVPATKPTFGAVGQRGPQRPKDRWIDELSGQKATLTMGKKSQDVGCNEEYSHCERPEAPKDINVTGVVVKTERLVSSPTEPLEGRVVRGHYLNHTPAVYVK